MRLRDTYRRKNGSAPPQELARKRLGNEACLNEPALQCNPDLTHFQLDELHALRRDAVAIEPRQNAVVVEAPEFGDADRGAGEVFGSLYRRVFGNDEVLGRMGFRDQISRCEGLQRDIARDCDRNRERVCYPDVEVACERRCNDVGAAPEVGDVRIDSICLERTGIRAVKRFAQCVVRHRPDPDGGKRRLCEYRS